MQYTVAYMYAYAAFRRMYDSCLFCSGNSRDPRHALSALFECHGFLSLRLPDFHPMGMNQACRGNLAYVGQGQVSQQLHVLFAVTSCLLIQYSVGVYVLL